MSKSQNKPSGKTQAEMLNSYITDMQALEVHIEKAVFAQVSDLDNEDPAFAQKLNTIHDMVCTHITQLGVLADARGIAPGGVVAEHIKKVVSAVAGLGAAAIDLVRHEKLPKDLRDDYTAFSLAEVGYAMLHASAMVLEKDDEEVMELALSHMNDYAQATGVLRELATASVLRYLEKEGISVSDSLYMRVLEAQSAVKAAR